MTLEEQIKESAQLFQNAYNQGDVNTIVSLYDDDAVMLSPECAIEVGIDAVKHCYEQAISLGWNNFQQTTVEIKTVDTIAYHIGQYTIDSPEANGNSTQVKGKYIDVYKLHNDGTWKIHVSAFNYNHSLNQA